MKSDLEKQKKAKLPESVQRKMELWKRMEEGDVNATIQLTIDFGMAKEEDFPVEFRRS